MNANPGNTMVFTPAQAPDAPRPHIVLLTIAVFLFICIYLLLTLAIRNREDSAIKLPVMAPGVAAAQGPADVILNLSASGDLTANGAPLSLDQLHDWLVSRRAATTHRQPLHVVIRADGALKYQTLDRVRRIVLNSGVETFVIRTREEDRP